MSIVEVNGLTKVYPGGIVALSDVSLAIEQGEIYALLGPNGAGKTTLFKVLLGITQLTSGSAKINGLPPSNPESRRKVGYLPENHRFPSHLTGYGLIRFTGRLCGSSDAEIDARSDNLLELVGMSRWKNVKIKKYSKGMMQRIGLAQAMISDPDILMLDEPTDGVDPVGKIEIREVLERIRSDGKSIVLNSHLLSEVESVADRVAILSKGKLLKIGTVDQLTSRGSQYEIEADIGDRKIELPENIGKIVTSGEKRIVVELPDERSVDRVIDMLREQQISIRSVKPVKITLEQSFLETVSDEPEAGS